MGRSDVPEGPYDLEVMAADAVAVLDDLGVDSAHVMGASMGGIMSQILGVRHQERVRSLTLACTGCHHLQWRRDLLAEQLQELGVQIVVPGNHSEFPKHQLRALNPLRVFVSLDVVLNVAFDLVASDELLLHLVLDGKSRVVADKAEDFIHRTK